MKSYGVTIQMKPLQQYFHMVLFIFKYFTKWNLGFVFNFDLRTLGSKRVKRHKGSSHLPSDNLLQTVADPYIVSTPSIFFPTCPPAGCTCVLVVSQYFPPAAAPDSPWPQDSQGNSDSVEWEVRLLQLSWLNVLLSGWVAFRQHQAPPVWFHALVPDLLSLQCSSPAQGCQGVVLVHQISHLRRWHHLTTCQFPGIEMVFVHFNPVYGSFLEQLQGKHNHYWWKLCTDG